MKNLHTLAAVALCSALGLPPAWAADGDLDPSFGTGGQVMTDFDHGADLAQGVAVQADGKLVVVGTSYQNNDYSKEDFAIARYKPGGGLDKSFGVNGRVKTDFAGLAAVASSVVIQPDGKIVVAGGAFPLFTFAGDFKIVRYNPDGSLDTGFGDGGIVTTVFPGQGSYAFAVALQPDGKIVAAGTDYVDFSSDESSNTDFALARYNPDGSPDTSFGSNGQVTTDFFNRNDDALAILIQPDGKLVAVGSATNPITYYDFAVARYMPNGSLDASFGQQGRVTTDFNAGGGFDEARSAVLQPDGKIVAAGSAASADGIDQRFALVRYNANGTLDKSFGRHGRKTITFGSYLQTAYEVLLQPDGKLVSVGFADTESSDSDFLLARCLPDGSLDSSFGNAGKVRTSFGNLNGGAEAALLQTDGKIVAVGFQATSTDKAVEFAVARYLNSGSLARRD